MPFGGANDKLQCPCMKCLALLPTPTLLGSAARKKHRQHFGLPSDVVIEEEDIDVEEKHIEPIVGLAPVDKELFAKDLVLLVVNHGISWKAAELVVKLVNAHALHRFFVFPLPATTYQLKKITGCRPGNAKLLAVCPVCDFVFDAHQHVCTPCGTPPRLRAQRQLLVNDISITIKQMFGNAKIAEALEYACHRKTGDGDSWDADIMRDIPLGTPHFSTSYDNTQHISSYSPCYHMILKMSVTSRCIIP